MVGIGVAELVVLGMFLVVPAGICGVLAYLFLFKAKRNEPPS